MHFKFLKKNQLPHDLELRYHPEDEQEAIQMKEFIEFESQSIHLSEKMSIEIAKIVYIEKFKDYFKVVCEDDTFYISYKYVEPLLESPYFIEIQPFLYVHDCFVYEYDEQLKRVYLKGNIAFDVTCE